MTPPNRPIVCREPLAYYIEKLERGDPFASLLYGDGEFHVMTGNIADREFTNYRERVNPRLRTELLASLLDENRTYQGEILRGTDPNLVNWEEYQGRDVDAMRSIGDPIRELTAPYHVQWVDGVVWDRAVREGELFPLFRILRERSVLLVGHPKLGKVEGFRDFHFLPIPPLDAWSSTDSLEKAVLDWNPPAKEEKRVYLVCAGLGAIPLILRLAEQRRRSTFLDLGSVFDVFAGLGAERGWRSEIYQDPDRLAQATRRNLEGVFP